MRRIFVPIALVLAAALAPAAPAAAAKRSYAGDVEPSGSIAFAVKSTKHGGGKIKKDLALSEIPITCEEGKSTTTATLGFSLEINDRNRFEGRASNQDKALLVVKGKVRRGGSSGKAQISGPAPLDDGTTGTDCDTGKLRWTADRM